MAIDAFVADLDVVVEQVRRRFHHDRVVLLGHSWGTAIGTLYAAAHPEKVAAYVGIGQIASMPEGVFFFLGRFDWQVPAVVAASYFDTIDAPSKRLVWFEGSAHNAPFEESAAFVGARNEWVRPAAETGRCDGASCTAGGCALETHETGGRPAKGDAR